MNKDAFESQLEALFDQPPELHDAAEFTIGVQRRLARLARWRSDIMSATWLLTIGAVIWALVSGFDTPAVAVVTAQAGAAITAVQDLGGGWLVPALAVGAALLYLALEDQLARD